MIEIIVKQSILAVRKLSKTQIIEFFNNQPITVWKFLEFPDSNTQIKIE